jgi:hypothetical protein
MRAGFDDFFLPGSSRPARRFFTIRERLTGRERTTIGSPGTASFVEEVLDDLGLSNARIQAQAVEELEESLRKIDSAIDDPDSLAVVEIHTSRIWTRHEVRTWKQYSIVSILLEKKQLILSRIADIATEEQIKGLRSEVSQVSNDDQRNRLLERIDELEAKMAQQEELDRQVRERRKQESSEANRATLALELDMQRLERRSRVYQSFLARESVATIVGALLLVGLTVALVVAMFIHTAVPELLANSFLIILGYFFGQTTSRRMDNDASV